MKNRLWLAEITRRLCLQSRETRRRRHALRERRLVLEPLEGRQLLSASPFNPYPVSILGAPGESPEGSDILLASSVTNQQRFDFEWQVTKDGEPWAAGSDPSLGLMPEENGSYEATLNVTRDPAVPASGWLAGPQMHEARNGMGVTVGNDGFIYAIGGDDGGIAPGAPSRTAERLNEATMTWEWIAPMSDGRSSTDAVTDSSGRIWAIGGTTPAGVMTDTVERYDPATNTWSMMSSRLHTPRGQAGVAITADDTIYIFGGYGTSELSSMERYNPATDRWEWEGLPALGIARTHPAAAVDQSGRIYAIGGQSGHAQESGTAVERYDPLSNQWTTLAPLPQIMMNPAAFAVGDEIYAVGGYTGGGYTNACYIYSPATNSWRAGPSMDQGVGIAKAAMSDSGLVYVIGGEHSAGFSTRDVSIFVPSGGSDSASISVTNAAPDVSAFITDAPVVGTGMEGVPVSVVATFEDPGTADTHTAVIDWGDGTQSAGEIVEIGGSGFIAAEHTYARGGLYAASLTVADDDLDSVSATATNVVSGVGVSQGVLYVVGTEANDRVLVSNGANSTFSVFVNFLPVQGGRPQRVFPKAGVNRIAVVLGEGSDYASISSRVNLTATLDGGPDNDVLVGGGGSNILIGDAGDDVLVGGAQRDLLIGGEGRDRLTGNGGDDILIGCSTSLDPDDDFLSPQFDQALLGVLAEWNAAAPYPTRVGRIRPMMQAIEDNARDYLYGNAGRDWFFAKRTGTNRDILVGRRADEWVDETLS